MGIKIEKSRNMVSEIYRTQFYSPQQFEENMIVVSKKFNIEDDPIELETTSVICYLLYHDNYICSLTYLHCFLVHSLSKHLFLIRKYYFK